MPKLSFIEEIALQQSKDNAELWIIFNRIQTRDDKKYIADGFKKCIETSGMPYGIKPAPSGPFLVYPLEDDYLLGYVVKELIGRYNGVIVGHMLPDPDVKVFFQFAQELLG